METEIQENVPEDTVSMLRGEGKGLEVKDVLIVHAVDILLHKVPECPLGNVPSR